MLARGFLDEVLESCWLFLLCSRVPQRFLLQSPSQRCREFIKYLICQDAAGGTAHRTESIVDVRQRAHRKNRAWLGLCVRGKTAPRSRSLRLPNGQPFARLTRAWEATKSALTTELYDRGALTTNCWPCVFYDVTEVLA